MTNEEKEAYYALSPRDALTFDLKSVKEIYMQQNLYSQIKPKLQMYIEESKKYQPNLFKKK